MAFAIIAQTVRRRQLPSRITTREYTTFIMVNDIRQNAMPATIAKPRPLPTPLYGSVVVALTVFLVGLTIWRSPIEGYLVTAEVTSSESPERGNSPVASTDQPTPPQPSRQQIANAVRAAEIQVHASGWKTPNTALSSQRLSQIIQNVKIKANGGNGGFEVSFVGGELAWSMAVVDHLVHQISFGRSKGIPSGVPTASSVRRAKWLAEQSRHYERKARFDMEDALNVHFDQLQDPSGVFARKAIASSQSESGSTRTRLKSQFEVPGTSAIPSANGNGWGAQPVAFASQAAPEAEFCAALFAESAEYRELREQYEVAIQQREAAEQRFSQLVAWQQTAIQEGPVAATGVIHPAALVRQIGGRPSGASVLTIGMLALLCGTLMCWRITTLRGLAQINSIDELQATLAMPLVGQISIDPMPACLRRRASWGASVRWCTQAGELILVLMITLFLLSVLSDSPAAKELVDNPLGTFVHRVASSSGM